MCMFLGMRQPHRSIRHDHTFPYTTLVRSTGVRKRVRAGERRCAVSGLCADLVQSGFWSMRKQPLAQFAIHFRASAGAAAGWSAHHRSEEHTSELQSLMRISYAVFCLTKKKE